MERISLDSDDFRKLVSGEVVNISGVEISLQDIGFDEMRMAIDDEEEDLGGE